MRRATSRSVSPRPAMRCVPMRPGKASTACSSRASVPAQEPLLARRWIGSLAASRAMVTRWAPASSSPATSARSRGETDTQIGTGEAPARRRAASAAAATLSFPTVTWKQALRMSPARWAAATAAAKSSRGKAGHSTRERADASALDSRACAQKAQLRRQRLPSIR